MCGALFLTWAWVTTARNDDVFVVASRRDLRVSGNPGMGDYY